MSQHILVFDHGTTGIKSCLMDQTGAIVGRGYQKFEQIYPQPGWVEHRPEELWSKTLETAKRALEEAQTTWEDITAIGITNQRETVVMWDAQTGEPIHNAIVWQCRRTTEYCEALKSQGYESRITEKTGLVLDPYFSASKIRWMLDHVPVAKELLAQGWLKFGTVDSWILWKLTGAHATDLTNASRTMLFDIHRKVWDPELLDIFGVPETILPEVKKSNARFGETNPALTGGKDIPVMGILGDQQAALHGQKCWTPGTAKSTYGTGAFLVMNTGDKPVLSYKGLLTTLATDAMGNPAYALEGAIFLAGGTIEWLQNQLGILQHPSEIDTLAGSLSDNGGVYFVPAMAGLAAPYWDANARGVITGLSQESGKAHLVRAAVEAMAYQTREVLDAMQEESGLALEALRVDGGVTRSGFLMRFLADMIHHTVIRMDDPELTAKGAGYLAGLSSGFWQSPEEIQNLPEQMEAFQPDMPEPDRACFYQGWLLAVQKTLSVSVSNQEAAAHP